MNIKDFLIENYIWLLVIILITIVTIIGFLADKKRGGKKENKIQQPMPQNINNQPVNNQMMNNQQLSIPQPIQYQQIQPTQQINNATAMNLNNMDTTIRPIDPINNNIPLQQPMVYNQPQVMQTMNAPVEVINNPQPVENITQNITQEPMYQPLSEQKPVFAPKPIPDYSNMQPINETPNLVNTNQSEINTLNAIPPIQSTTPNQIRSNINETTMNNSQMYNVQQPESIQNNNFGTIPNFIPNNTTIPQPVNSVTEPNLIPSQPTTQNSYNQPGVMPQNLNQSQPSEQQNINMVQPGINPQPINFVYGPQNNNQNM